MRNSVCVLSTSVKWLLSYLRCTVKGLIAKLQQAVRALALDVQRFFDFPCTPFLRIVNDLCTVPHNFVADLFTCFAIADPFALFFSTCLCAPSNARQGSAASHSIQGTLYITPFLRFSWIESFKPLHTAHFQGEAWCATTMPSGCKTLPHPFHGCT